MRAGSGLLLLAKAVRSGDQEPGRADRGGLSDSGRENERGRPLRRLPALKTQPVLRSAMPESKETEYRVLLVNDTETPMDFVVDVLQTLFHMEFFAATKLMLHVHHEGSAECGVYSHEEAARLVKDVVAFARAHKQPLQCVMVKR
jgi:ATP-dependent Clp protease adaptor protein ClpS